MKVYAGILESGITPVYAQNIADEVHIDASNTEGWQIEFSKIPAKV